MDPQKPGNTLVRAVGALLITGTMAMGTMATPVWSQGMNLVELPRDPYPTIDTKPDAHGSRYVRISQAGAVNTPNGPALHMRVTNITDEPIRVAVIFDAPGKSADCTETADLDPAAGQRYVCPQSIIRSGIVYPVTVEVRKAGKRGAVERIRRSYQFGKDHLASLAGQVGSGIDG